MAKKLESNKYTDYQLKEAIRNATLSCYGIRNVEYLEISSKKGKKEGIILVHNPDNTISTDIYVSLVNDVKFTEVLRSTQQTVGFLLNKQFPKLFKAINIFAIKGF